MPPGGLLPLTAPWPCSHGPSPPNSERRGPLTRPPASLSSPTSPLRGLLHPVDSSRLEAVKSVWTSPGQSWTKIFILTRGLVYPLCCTAREADLPLVTMSPASPKGRLILGHPGSMRASEMNAALPPTGHFSRLLTPLWGSPAGLRAVGG